MNRIDKQKLLHIKKLSEAAKKSGIKVRFSTSVTLPELSNLNLN